MQQTHFATIDSTQKYLIEHLNQYNLEQPIIISAETQTDGIGRNQNSWTSLSNALFFSFTLTPTIAPTMTPIEVGLILISYLKENYHADLQLKWPNDLFIHNKKCAGIICQMIKNKIVVGVGLNLGAAKIKNLKAATITDIKLTSNDLKNIPLQIYDYINNHRKSAELIKIEMNQYCLHLNKLVTIDAIEQTITGKFLGIGDNGEALIEQNNEIVPVMAGSLFVI